MTFAMPGLKSKPKEVSNLRPSCQKLGRELCAKNLRR